jgi:hypothetical protein
MMILNEPEHVCQATLGQTGHAEPAWRGLSLTRSGLLSNFLFSRFFLL